MLKITRRKYPLEAEGRINALNSLLEQERHRNDDLEEALVEIAEISAAQDDAIVELAELIGG